jgi:hypothetical protein
MHRVQSSRPGQWKRKVNRIGINRTFGGITKGRPRSLLDF